MTAVRALDDGTLDWVAEALGLSDGTHRGIRSAWLDAARAGTPQALGIEVHHDGSGQVDATVFVPGRPGTAIVAGRVLTTGGPQAWEYDLSPDGTARRAGIFHDAADWDVPAIVAPLGRPLLVAELDGRDGRVRLVYALRHGAHVQRFATGLRTMGPAGLPVDRLRQARDLATDPRTLRAAIELQPSADTLTARLGVELVGARRPEDLAPALARLGVPADQAEAHEALRHRLPVARERGRAIPVLPGMLLDRRVEAIGLVHASVAWTGDTARLKSYLMVHSLAPGCP